MKAERKRERKASQSSTTSTPSTPVFPEAEQLEIPTAKPSAGQSARPSVPPLAMPPPTPSPAAAAAVTTPNGPRGRSPPQASTPPSKAQTPARRAAEAGLETLTLAFEPYLVKVEGGVVYLKLRVGDALVLVRAELEAKAAALGDTAAGRRLRSSGARAVEAVEPRVLYVKARCGEVAVLTRARLEPLAARCDDARAAVERSVAEAVALAAKRYAAYHASARALVAEKYAAAQGLLASTAEPVVARARGGYVVVSGKVGDAKLYVKAKRDSSKALALESYASAVRRVEGYAAPAVASVAKMCDGAKVKAISVIEPRYVRVKNGVVTVRGKIGEADILLKSKVSGVVSGAADKLEPYCRPVYIKVSGGYLYVTGKVGDAVLYIQTEISNTCAAAKVKALTTYTGARKMLVDGYVTPAAAKVAETYGSARAKALTIADGTKTKATAALANTKAKVRTVVADEKFKGTAAAATGSAVALGASGGAAGLVTGGTIGAAVGLVPALLTFGLSIPIGAAIGAGTGLCVGTAAGGTVGLVGGGAVGYGVQSHKDEIGSGVSGALSKAGECRDYVKGTAMQSKDYLRAKLAGKTGGTGGSA